MKVLLYADPHFCQSSSILRSYGYQFSTRLENLVDSLNWVEETAQKENCDTIICAGDFFDKPELNAQEITALSQIEFRYNIKHYYLCGNHEMGAVHHGYSSVKLFDGYDNAVSVDRPMCLVDNTDSVILLIPYMLNSERRTIREYVDEFVDNKHKAVIVVSHNDIKMNYGGFLMEDGFDLQDIIHNCDWFFNGHLHNGGQIDKHDNVINIGNLTGQNFSENGFLYKHGVYVFDTDNMYNDCRYIENPYAISFYQIDFTSADYDLRKLSRAVVSIRCYENQYDKVSRLCAENNIVASKIQIVRTLTESVAESKEELEMSDYSDKFTEYVLSNIGNDALTKEELERLQK